jgi:prepilin-type N-terminal cleavage/methylation domain-containing protein
MTNLKKNGFTPLEVYDTAKKYYKNGKLLTGFTLIEVIITIAIFSVLIFGVSKMLADIFQNSNSQIATMDNIDYARSVSSRFVSEIRSAAYGSYPLITAQDSNIKFYSSVGAVSGKVNMINYYVADTTLYKDVFTSSGSPPTYTISSHTAVLKNLSNGSAPLFYYYNGDYDGVNDIEPLLQPVNITQVRFVKINLGIQNQINKQNPSTFYLTSGASIRALKDNLSN